VAVYQEQNSLNIRAVASSKPSMKLFLGIICATTLLIAVANGQTSSTTTTTTATAKGTETTSTITESVGVITEFTPGAKIVLSSGTGEPVTYKFGKSVTYMNANGKEINASKIRKDRKVRVHYVKEGNDMLVDKVTVVKD
jgi:hypothetical protein